ncbi:MAG TPA: hypothetical protein VHE78_06210 [Gemmatimonadaceae bacterium]|nr:hypothetical protein [Gemmatimonadaceae bacterium]
MWRFRLLSTALTLCYAGIPSAAAQAVRTTLATAVTATITGPFVKITAVRELASGAIIVLDRGDHRVWLADVKRNTRVLIGKPGTAANEYDQPYALLFARESTFVYDFGSRRLLTIDGQGELTTGFDFATVSANAAAFGLPPRAADDRGHFYLDGPPVVRTAQGMRAADSTPILRAGRLRGKVDTIAFIRVPPGSVKVTAMGSGTMTTTGGENPFTPSDQWVVAPDGRVALVHAVPYHIEWISAAGARTQGPVIPVEPIHVTEADKAEYARNAAGAGAPSAGVRGPGSDKRTAPDHVRDDWPAAKPPFLRDAAHADTKGFVWVLRANAAGDGRRRFDVFNALGQLAHRVGMPPGTQVAGFGANTIYAVRTDQDGVQRLEVFPRPNIR